MNRSLIFCLGMVLAISAMPFEVLPSSIEECNLCRHIVGAAERHFQPNVTTQDSLKRELDRECVAFSHTHDKNVSQQCIVFVNANIATIYADISAGKRPEAVCVGIQVCQAHPTVVAAYAVRSALTECLTCEFIIGRAENHYHNRNVTDKNRLLRELEHECIQLDLIEGDAATIKCLDIVRQNIDVIFRDVQNHKSPRDVCVDIGECQASSDSTSAPPADLEHVSKPVPDECHTCEFIIGRAEHHYHNRNVTNKNRLLRELEHECIQLDPIEGDGATIKCLDIVRQNIDVIFRDVQNHKPPLDVCVDIGECQVSSDPTPPPPSVSFFL